MKDLLQKLNAFMEGSLLKKNGKITQHGEMMAEDEEVTPFV